MSRPNKDLSKLVEQARSGEAEAFGHLYDLFLDKIYRFVFLKVSNKQEAEDLSQQVFMKAWENIWQFQDEGVPFSSWLYKIARNLVIDFYRTRRAVISLEETIESDVLLDEVDIGEEIVMNYDKQTLLASLNSLTDGQKDVVILRYIEDMSYDEIAKITGKNQAALRILQYRGMRKLKAILEGKNERKKQ